MATRNRSKPDDDGQVLIPAVGYLRCSTDDQVDASIPAQKASIEKWAGESGYRILRWYIDEGISGWKEDREAFQRLMTDLETRHDFRAVLCWHTNRFSRFPVLEANHYWFLLDRAGVHLATVAQGRQDWQDIGSWLKASIEQHGDAQHRFKLSADVKRGLRAVAEKGRWLGRVPTGYDCIDGRLVPNAHAQIVVGMFQDCLTGASLRHIAKQLNAAGIPSPRGGKWGRSTVLSIVSNEVYAGVFRNRDIEIPNNHPALIDLETFRAVEQLLDVRKANTTPLEDGGGYLLSGLVRCGKCGSAMGGRTETHNYLVYNCRGYSDRGVCDKNTVHQEELLGYVLDTIEAHWMNPQTVKAIRDELHSIVAAEHPKVDGRKIEGQLATLDAKLTKAKRRLVEVDADMLPLVQEQIRELRSQHDQLQASLRAASTPRKALFAETDDRIDRAVSAFCGLRGVLESADTAHRRDVLRQTVGKVEVWTTKEPNGRQSRYMLDRGLIHLRSQEVVHLTQLLCRPSNAPAST